MNESRPVVLRALARCKREQFVLIWRDSAGAEVVGLCAFKDAAVNLRILNATNVIEQLRDPEWAHTFTPQPWPYHVVLELTPEKSRLGHVRNCGKRSA